MKHGPRKIGISAPDRIFMRVGNFTFRVRQGEFSDDSDGTTDPEADVYTEAASMGIKPIWLGFTKTKGRFYVELTGMTGEELDAFEKGITAGIAAAREIVTYLDREADVVYDDDTPLIALRGLKSSPIVIHRKIRPFIGTPMDPIEVKDEVKAYNEAFIDDDDDGEVGDCRRSPAGEEDGASSPPGDATQSTWELS